eukprot:15469377-Alexandrium_andersonii.AAC.1
MSLQGSPNKHYGNRIVDLRDGEAGHHLKVNFSLSDSLAAASVSGLLDDGYRVVCDAEADGGSYVARHDGGTKIRLRRVGPPVRAGLRLGGP